MPYTDPAVQKAAQRQHYLDNKELFLERQREYRRNKRQWLKELKDSLKCEKCGASHPAILDFHHVNPEEKEWVVAQAVNFWGLSRLQKEIAKCQCLCSNCHRILHWEEKQV